jgi:hypothetical protein
MTTTTDRPPICRWITGRAIVLLGILAALVAACGPGGGAPGY